MKRSNILKSLLIVPVVATGLFLYQGRADAEDFLEITKCPARSESAVPHKSMRILQSDGLFYEDFESMTEGVFTDGWTTTATPGLPDGKWGVGSLGTDGKAMAGASGYTYAYILGNRDRKSDISHDAWLFSPQIKMEKDREYQIEFFSYMGMSPVIEKLEIALLSSPDAESVIKEIDTVEDGSGKWNIYSYTFTPSESGTYYLGFHCMSPPLANAILIDDVKISEGPTSGFFGLAGVDVGVTDMLRGTISNEYEVINRGVEPLVLGFKSASPEISVSGLPLTVDYRASDTFTVNFTPGQTGEYTGELVLTTNDPSHPEVTLIVLAHVKDVPVTNYAYEDFEAGDPQGWEYTISAVNTDYYLGHNGPRNFYTRSVYCLSEDGPVGFTTHYVDLGDDPEFSFWYKMTDCDLMGVASGPTADEIPVMQASISIDNGMTYEPFWELGQDSGLHHKQSSDFQQIRIPLKEYAGKRCRVKLEMWGDIHPLEHDFIIQVDDVALGTPHKTDLRAVNLSGDDQIQVGEQANESVFVENLGTEAVSSYKVSIIDEDGNVLSEKSETSLGAGEKKRVSLAWVPEAEGPKRIKAVVSTENDGEKSNDASNILAVDVLSPDNTAIKIGSGREFMSSSVPLNLGSRETASQTLYYANEIGTDRGTISSVELTACFATDHLTEAFEVFLAETDRDDYSDKGWEDTSLFKQVFKGQVFIPEGTSEFVIPFDTPYEYNGKNLVLMIRKMSDWFIVNKPLVVYKSDNLRSTFCSYLRRGEMIPGDYSEREAVNVYARLKVNITKSPNGEVSGKVTDSDGSVAGAKVAVAGTQLFTFTDNDGNYTLPEIAEGNRSLTVSKYGYYTSEGNEVEVTDGCKLIKDLRLEAFPKFTVSGTVSSETGEPIADTRVYLEGYADYKAVTDNNGHYEITGIYGNTGTDYTLKTESAFFEPYRQKGLDIKADGEINIVLKDSHYRVHNLRATQEEETLRLDWDEPITEFKHDNGKPVDYMGWNHGHSECAIFTTYHKRILVKEIRWYTSAVYGPHANFNVFLFGIGEDGYPDPNNILYMAKNVDYTDESWNTHVLKTPVEVEGCAVGVSCDGLLGLGRTEANEEYPFTPLMHFFSGDSYRYELGIADFTSYMDCHPMLRIGGDFLGDLDGKDVKGSRSAIRRPACEYTVFRLSGPDWKERVLVGTTTETGIEDKGFAELPVGSYRYAVVSNYEGGDSEEVISSVITVKKSGIEKIEDQDVRITYNSAADALTVGSPDKIAYVEIFASDGRLVMRLENVEESNDLSHISAGLYIVRGIRKDKGSVTLKFTK